MNNSAPNGLTNGNPAIDGFGSAGTPDLHLLAQLLAQAQPQQQLTGAHAFLPLANQHAPARPLSALELLLMIQGHGAAGSQGTQGDRQPQLQSSARSESYSARIEPSEQLDRDIASRLRDARRNNRSYRLAAESMAMTHGYSAAQWKDYVLDRLDQVTSLLRDNDAPPVPHKSATVKKLVLGTKLSAQPMTPASASTSDPVLKKKRGRPPRALAPSSLSSPARVGLSSSRKRRHRDRGGDDDASSEPDGQEDSDYHSPRATNTVVFSGTNEDRHPSYLNSNKMGAMGGRATAGDLNAIARWIVDHPTFFTEPNADKWQNFSLQYPQRTSGAWMQIYWGRKNEVLRRVNIILAKKDCDPDSNESAHEHSVDSDEQPLDELLVEEEAVPNEE